MLTSLTLLSGSAYHHSAQGGAGCGGFLRVAAGAAALPFVPTEVAASRLHHRMGLGTPQKRERTKQVEIPLPPYCFSASISEKQRFFF